MASAKHPRDKKKAGSALRDAVENKSWQEFDVARLAAEEGPGNLWQRHCFKAGAMLQTPAGSCISAEACKGSQLQSLDGTMTAIADPAIVPRLCPSAPGCVPAIVHVMRHPPEFREGPNADDRPWPKSGKSNIDCRTW